MVVSEIGEIWSPHTAPASTAATFSASKDTLLVLITAVTIGIMIPKVPQDVPVEKESPIATAKNSAGSSTPMTALPLTTFPTKFPSAR